MVDAHLDVVAGLVALPGVGAGIVDHDSLEVDGHLSVGQFIPVHDFIGEIGDVYAGIALAGDVEIVFLEIGELVEKCKKRLVVVHSHAAVVVLEVPLGGTETDSSRRLDIEQICLCVPG